jgi:hypothetical protein
MKLPIISICLCVCISWQKLRGGGLHHPVRWWRHFTLCTQQFNSLTHVLLYRSIQLSLCEYFAYYKSTTAAQQHKKINILFCSFGKKNMSQVQKNLVDNRFHSFFLPTFRHKEREWRGFFFFYKTKICFFMNICSLILLSQQARSTMYKVQ